MITEILTESSEDLDKAAKFLKDGKTVVFPTETVYGLGANALDENAVKKIFEAKGRPSDNPLIVHISSLEMLDEVVESVSETAKLLIDKYWPGPLTLIFKKKSIIPRSITADLETVAVRFPSNNTAYELIERANVPIAAPSANLSGKPSPTRFNHAFEDLNGRVDAIIKGASCEVGVESTVLDVSGDVPVLLRPGKVTFEELKELVGDVRLGAFDASKEKDNIPMSPGVKYKHYSPKAEVIILKGSIENIKKYIINEAKYFSEVNTADGGKKLAVLNFEENIPEFDGICMVMSLGKSNNPDEAAANLFNCLRELDEKKVDIIYAPEIPDTGKWRAVQNRLYKAAGGKIIEITEELFGEKIKSDDVLVDEEFLKFGGSDMKSNDEILKGEDVNSAESLNDTEPKKIKSDDKLVVSISDKASVSDVSETYSTAAEKSKEEHSDFGGGSSYKDIATKDTLKVLFICTGNTCRSPMAEKLFNVMTEREGIDAVSISAGTYAYNNLPVSDNAVKAMNMIDLDISGHKSHQITREMIAESDLVLTMTDEHSDFLNTAVPEFSKKIMTVARYIDLDISVEDPYGNRLDDYVRCRNQLEKIIKLIIIKLKKSKKEK